MKFRKTKLDRQEVLQTELYACYSLHGQNRISGWIERHFRENIYFPICVLQHFFNFVNDCRTNYLSAYMCVWEFEQLSNRLLWYGVYCNTWGYRIFTINQVAVVQGQLWHDTEIRTQLIRAKLMIVMLFFLNYSEML